MRLLSSCGLLMTLAAALQAQAPSKVLHNNPHVRVLLTTMQPGEPIPVPAEGRNRVLIYFDSGRVTQTSADGDVETVQLEGGEVRWVPAAGPSVIENVTNRPIQMVQIELKAKQQPAVVVPDLDPIKVDPKHWTLELENDYVRVARVRFGPLEKGVRHQHVRNYLVVYMNQQAKGNRGNVNLHLDEGTTTHTEHNPLDQAVERIAIELK